MSYTLIDYFPPTYQHSRTRFIDAIHTLQKQGFHTQLWSHSLIDQPLPEAIGNAYEAYKNDYQHAVQSLENLTIDVAYVGPSQATHVLCISSGTHGVEGFLGAALQHALLAKITHHLTSHPYVAFLLIHAVNPYGFHYLRRNNEQNIDVNRNCLFTSTHQGSHPHYSHLKPLLCPSIDQLSTYHFYRHAVGYLFRHGFTAMTQAVTQGQYLDPHALFFGGFTLSRSALIVKNNLLEWLQHAQKVIHLDIHSGFGKYTDYILTSTADYPHEILKQLAPFYAPQEIDNLRTHAKIYKIQGELLDLCTAVAEHAPHIHTYVPLLVECGTYHSIKILQALRRENTLYHALPFDHPRAQKARQQLKECFLPHASQWKKKTLHHLLEITEQSLNALLRNFS